MWGPSHTGQRDHGSVALSSSETQPIPGSPHLAVDAQLLLMHDEVTAAFASAAGKVEARAWACGTLRLGPRGEDEGVQGTQRESVVKLPLPEPRPAQGAFLHLCAEAAVLPYSPVLIRFL